MASWIERAKKTLQEIIDNVVKSSGGNLKVRVAFIGYRDHCSSEKERFEIQKFTEDINQVKTFIASVRALGGGDTPEDIPGGMR
jgi:hypothetical protein